VMGNAFFEIIRCCTIAMRAGQSKNSPSMIEFSSDILLVCL